MSAWMVMQYKELSANSNLGKNQLCRGALAGIASGQPTQMLKGPNLTPKGLKGWTNQGIGLSAQLSCLCGLQCVTRTIEMRHEPQSRI